MTRSHDLPLPDLRVDSSNGPRDPEIQDWWVRRRRVVIWMRAWGFEPNDSWAKKRIGDVLVFRADRRERMNAARAARAAGEPAEVDRYVREARTKHRYVMRHLRLLRQAIEGRGP